jgi:ribosomal protein S18 acetylase RimI-like enzyme
MEQVMAEKMSRCTELTEKHWELLLKADPSKQQVQKYSKTGYIFELRLDEDVAGIICITPKTPDRVEIMNLSIHEKWQGRGYAKTLIEYACSFSVSKGHRIAEIGTGNSSLNQLALYQKAGFRIMGIDHDYFSRNYSEPIYENGILCRDMIRLERKL